MKSWKPQTQPLRVVQACDLQAGGIASLILAICQELNREKVQFDYLVYRDQAEFWERRALELGGQKLVASNTDAPNKAARFLWKFFRTYQVLRQERVEIFHVNVSTPYDCMVGLAARLAGVQKIILHAHNSRLKKSGMGHRLFQGICRLCLPLCGDIFFACSDLAAEFMFGSKPHREVLFLKNGVNTERFRFNETLRRETRMRYGFQDALVVGCVGRLCPAKNHYFLLQVFAALLYLRPDARLVLIGRGELEDTLLAQADRLGIWKKLLHIPVTEEIEAFYAMMDIFLLPSLFEGLPVVGIEAQTAGLPCLFSENITRQTAVTDRARFLSLDRSAGEWAEQVATMALESTERREEYANRVRESGFEIKDTAAWLQKFYLNL